RISRYATIREWDGEVSPETYQKLEDSSLPTSEKHGFEKDREAYGPITYGALYEVLAPVLDGETLRYTKKPAQNTTQFFREELGISGLSTPDTVRGGTILVLFDPDQIISWASA